MTLLSPIHYRLADLFSCAAASLNLGPTKRSSHLPARRRGTGRPPDSVMMASTVVPDSGGLRSLAAVEPDEDPMLATQLGPTKQSSHLPARRRGTGRPPDSVLMASTVVPDSGGLRSLAAVEPDKDPYVGHLNLGQPNKPIISQHGAEGPGALGNTFWASVQV